jgi:hypothetical protein
MKKPKKFKDWRMRLQSFLWSRLWVPFKWQDNDCCTFACDGIKEMTGYDPGKWFRGKYITRFGAYKAIKEFSGGSFKDLAEKMAADMGAVETQNPKFGDIALVRIQNIDERAAKLSGGMTMGIVCNNGLVAVPGKDGMVLNPQAEIVKAWTEP